MRDVRLHSTLRRRPPTEYSSRRFDRRPVLDPIPRSSQPYEPLSTTETCGSRDRPGIRLGRARAPGSGTTRDRVSHELPGPSGKIYHPKVKPVRLRAAVAHCTLCLRFHA